MKNKLHILLNNFILILFLATFCFAQQTLRVRGRVVDDFGKPVPNAFVAMTDYSPPEDSIDWLILGSLADETGNFEITTYTNNTIINTFLFVSSSTSQKANRPIDAPFTILHKKNQIKGIPVTLRKDKDLNVGDIKVQVWFRPIELTILKNNKPLYKTEDDWHEFKLSVRDENGEVGGSSALSTNDRREIVNVEKGSVMLALPEGKWTFEFLSDWDDIKQNKYFAKSDLINVSRGDSILPVVIKVK